MPQSRSGNRDQLILLLNGLTGGGVQPVETDGVVVWDVRHLRQAALQRNGGSRS
jgi:hypothetical protein